MLNGLGKPVTRGRVERENAFLFWQEIRELPVGSGLDSIETTTEYSAALRPGAKRTGVEDYLRRKQVPFSMLCCVDHETTAFADLGQVGKNHDGWPFCSGATVNVAFVFSGKGILGRPNPEDVLKTIKLFTKMENCL